MVFPDISDRSFADLVRLEGRVAVVTGGALGIGRAVCRRLAEAGATVITADVDEKAAAQTAELLSSQTGGSVTAAAVDVRDSATVEALADSVVDTHGQIDVWVNNAGIYPNNPIFELSDGDWDRVLEVNVRGSFAGARAAAKHMIERGAGGVIVNVSSINGYRAFGPGLAHYTTTKHAVRGLTRALAVELGPHGIRVLAIAPTMVETEGVQDLRDQMGDSEFGAAMEALAGVHPAGRVGVPDDIARVAVFCASDLSSMMTGSTLIVDGGYLAL